MADPIREYLKEVEQNLKSGQATEHTHRPALKQLIEALLAGAQAINEPAHIACGAPDLVVTRDESPAGYVEAKDVGANLQQTERSPQLKRYLAALHNLILTDYLEFRWYVNGAHRQTVRLADTAPDGSLKRSSSGAKQLHDLFTRFAAQQPPVIAHPRELAERMAALSRLIRDTTGETFSQEASEGTLHGQLDAFRKTLIPNLQPAEFADMYAQTITYGLFAARIRTLEGQPFTRQYAAWNLPPTNPFLQKLFVDLAGPGLDKRIAWLVDDLALLLARADMSEVLRDFGKRTRQEDPVVHFYETFLAAYDPKMREARGVYYTPEPVVSFIVRSIDLLLKAKFGRALGLADPHVLLLDPAVGTATFLYFAVQHIFDTLTELGQAGAWDDYVASHLLPRLFGFELLMAPYTVAHMKLGMQLQELGYRFASEQRLGIYLTNTLEAPLTRTQTLGFAGYITEEANAAAEVKRDKPIMVVLGNPPYAVSSHNKGEHIEELMDRYKTAVRGEQNIQPLSDDYIKFLRFAQDRIERTGHGIVGMITNHSYLSGLIHRGMREELLKTFDDIYIVNLHGNALMGEKTPQGGADENVFDIRQGVAIALFVKQDRPAGPTHVRYTDLWGKRDEKYEYLFEYDVESVGWETLTPTAPHFFFVPRNLELSREYARGWNVTSILTKHSGGVKTHRDHFALDFQRESLQNRIKELRGTENSDEQIRLKYRLEDTRDWHLVESRNALRGRDDWANDFALCTYRPFDSRWIFYSGDVVELPRKQVMRHMLLPNLSLCTMRQVVGDPFRHVMVSRNLNDMNLLTSHHVSQVTFPLYLYTTPEDTAGTLFATLEPAREPNLAPQFITAVKETLRLAFIPDGCGDLEHTFGPEDVFHYLYAVLHSPAYRQRYAEFLKIDFPRVPLTSDRTLFRTLAGLGRTLVALHLLESPLLDTLLTRFPEKGANVVENVRYAEPQHAGGQLPAPAIQGGRVYINTTQYFEGVPPDVWEFYVGGYQVCHKWLKDRKGRKLTWNDIQHYQRIIVALHETIRLMAAIDTAIDAHGGWPIA